ncbi:MAG: ABC transporter transmembrane domain-containing protein, partial [Candidatus Hodarchaeales archaeon]
MWALQAEEYDRTYRDRDLFRRILAYFGPYKRSVLVVVTFLVLTAIANALVPILLAIAISNLVKSKDLSFLFLLIAFTLFLNLSGWLFNYFRQVHSARVIGDIVLDLRENVNTAVLNHDLSFFDKYPTGKIVSRVNTDSRDFGQSAALFMQTTSSFLVVAIMLVALAAINPRLSLIVILMIPIIFVIALSFRKIARKLTLLGQRALAVVNAYVQESISGISVAKTFRQEDKLHEKFMEVNNQSYRVNWKRGVTIMTIFPILTIIQGIILALIIFYGG